MANGRYPAISPNTSATVTVCETTSTDTKTTRAPAAHTDHTAPTGVPESPAWSSPCRTGPGRAGLTTAWCGDVNDSQISSNPTPAPRPATAPTSPATGQDRADVDAVGRVTLGVRRHPGGAHQPVPVAHEQRRGLDDVVLDPAGNTHDLLDPAETVVADAEVHEQVDRRRHGGHDEVGGDVLPGQQRQCAHLHQRLARRVRVQRRHPGKPGVQC